MNDTSMEGGPFGLHQADGAALEDATIYIKPGRTPSEAQGKVLAKLLGLIPRIKRHLKTDAAQRAPYIEEIYGAFQAGSIASDTPDLVTDSVAGIEARFSAEHLSPDLHRLINRNLMTLGGLLLMAAAAAFVAQTYPAISGASSFAFLAIGLICGRFISTALQKGESVASFSEFDAAKKSLSSPITNAMVDGIIAFVAVILFSAGFLVIVLAEGPLATGADGELLQMPQGLSTRMINSDLGDWKIDTGFGVLIGVARSHFWDRIKSLGRTLG